MKLKTKELSNKRTGERGAALITALLVSMLMLAAGGALILSTGMTAANAVDSTAEEQAYYAAEAGLQASLAVLRGNVASSPSGTSATFRTVVCGTSTNCTNSSDLSLWLPRTSGVVSISTSPALAYTLSVRDADYAEGATLPASPYSPRYLFVTSTGLGPKGARKVLEMKVDAYPFDFSARAAVAVRSSDVDTTGMVKLDLGASNPHAWNGNDQAIPPGASLPAFAVTNTADYDAGDGFGLASSGNLQGKAEYAIGADQANVLGAQQLVKLNPTSLEAYLKTANGARAFLIAMKAKAATLGRLNPTSNPIGTESDPQFTFIDGNLDLGGGDHGAGLMIVTGTVTQGGSSSFKGILLVMGEGKLARNGTPDALGALIIAKFSRTATTDFEAPYIDSSGGGNSLVGYDSEWVRKALNTLGSHVLGVVEK